MAASPARCSSPSLLCHRKNDITGMLDQMFSATEDRFGEHALSSSGRRRYTGRDRRKKEEYVDFVIASRIEQFGAFMEGQSLERKLRFAIECVLDFPLSCSCSQTVAEGFVSPL